jgi:hypothetical protein
MREWASCFKISPAILGISNLKRRLAVAEEQLYNVLLHLLWAARSVLYMVRWWSIRRRENEWNGPFIPTAGSRGEAREDAHLNHRTRELSMSSSRWRACTALAMTGIKIRSTRCREPQHPVEGEKRESENFSLSLVGATASLADGEREREDWCWVALAK